MNIDKILQLLTDKKGSECFFTVGIPPNLKIGKSIHNIGNTVLTSDQAHQSIRTFMGEERFGQFVKNKECNYGYNLKDVGRFRISAFFQKSEPGLVIRRLNSYIPSCQELSIPSQIADQVLQERGLILITGAAGAGKSTSMASLVDYRNQNSKGHIITIEDPVEYIHDHKNCIVTQRDVGLDTKSYEAGLFNALRQAPNLVVVGEIRSPGVMKHTVEFVETGHLCIATMHANNTYQALERIIHFFPPEQHSEILMDLSLSLRMVVGQQLVEGKEEGSVVPVHEILINTPRVADLIKNGNIDELNEAVQKGKSQGMQTFDQTLYDLVKAGKITQDRAMLHATSPNNLRLMLKMDQTPSSNFGSNDNLSISPVDSENQQWNS
ncbi:PilT/PilU family type 4a pilus ATPase [Endozoicomonas euniceicola]|uniref:PilT/PilU family type 4a pilus ATPase n=1 Tax=Endozoicomonas euniceicola TaxID=1234143 RepID=A0ABY6H2F4_9GAMM|nr:PilT/PilU family type 4a pilus ATPase [Endozoicomonas euniceicola]UYM18436.1 PilT/PilU family type 4a pilus ATPase [Endozoicomonas euniceicola]